MNQEHRGILVGMVLGDGYLSPNGKDNRYVSLRICHGAKQFEYLKHKVSLLQEILKCENIKINQINNNGYPGVLAVKGNKYFRILRKWIYKNNRKTFSRQVLSYLTPHGLAIWWMDDGSLYMKRRNGKICSREGILSTYVSLEENKLICEVLEERFGVRGIPVRHRDNYRIRFNTGELKKLVPVIEPYIIPSMFYKIDMQYS